MTNDVIGGRYSEALYDIALEKKKVLQLLDDLKKVNKVISGNLDLKKLIGHPSIDATKKKNIIQKAFDGGLDDFSLLILNYLIDKDRLVNLKGIIEEYIAIYNYKNSIVEVEATFAIKPSEKQELQLIQKLEKMMSKKVKIKVNVDKTIIGGGILKIGDKIMDGSLKRQFEMLKANL
jgi:F-type H+-transporting ATPase subunit delta